MGGPAADSDLGDEVAAGSQRRGLREWAGYVVLLLVVLAVAAAVVRNRKSFATTLEHVGVGGIALSLGFGLVGVGATSMQWRAVLAGLGVRFGARETAGIFFVSQLGKYLPGSVWPIVMQMEAGKARGASR